jgi:aminopeptidase-like protein
VSGGPVADSAIDERALLWVLNLSDGSRSLLDIAERSRVPFAGIRAAASTLERHGLVEETRSASE